MNVPAERHTREKNLEFLVVGLNHRTAPVEVRELLSLNNEQLPDALRAMNGHGAPGVILSTCNRSEFYILDTPGNADTGSQPSSEAGADRVKRFLVEKFGISLLDVDRYLYTYRGYDCIHHLFRVASSLDSMILGEEQIIGQVRDAYEAATTSIDHNLYILGSRVFQANYTSGLHVLEFGDLANSELAEVAFFDTFPDSEAAVFDGAWSVYPYLPSGTILVSDLTNGLFILSLQ